MRKNIIILSIVLAACILILGTIKLARIIIKAGKQHKVEFNKERVTVGSGLNLDRLVDITRNKNLSGCEFCVHEGFVSDMYKRIFVPEGYEVLAKLEGF